MTDIIFDGYDPEKHEECYKESYNRIEELDKEKETIEKDIADFDSALSKPIRIIEMSAVYLIKTISKEKYDELEAKHDKLLKHTSKTNKDFEEYVNTMERVKEAPIKYFRERGINLEEYEKYIELYKALNRKERERRQDEKKARTSSKNLIKKSKHLKRDAIIDLGKETCCTMESMDIKYLEESDIRFSMASILKSREYIHERMLVGRYIAGLRDNAIEDISNINKEIEEISLHYLSWASESINLERHLTKLNC